jgi:hypothetical protein
MGRRLKTGVAESSKLKAGRERETKVYVYDRPKGLTKSHK